MCFSFTSAGTSLYDTAHDYNGEFASLGDVQVYFLTILLELTLLYVLKELIHVFLKTKYSSNTNFADTIQLFDRI